MLRKVTVIFKICLDNIVLWYILIVGDKKEVEVSYYVLHPEIIEKCKKCHQSKGLMGTKLKMINGMCLECLYEIASSKRS